MKTPIEPFDNTDAIEAAWIRNGNKACLCDPVQSVCLDIQWGVVACGHRFLLTPYEISHPDMFFHFVFGGTRGAGSESLRAILRIAPKGVWLKLFADDDGFTFEDLEGAPVCKLAF